VSPRPVHADSSTDDLRIYRSITKRKARIHSVKAGTRSRELQLARAAHEQLTEAPSGPRARVRVLAMSPNTVMIRAVGAAALMAGSAVAQLRSCVVSRCCRHELCVFPALSQQAVVSGHSGPMWPGRVLCLPHLFYSACLLKIAAVPPHTHAAT
jgi:hypothetical protein